MQTDNVTSGEAGLGCSVASLSVVLLSLSLSEPELLSEPLWLLESSLNCSATSLLLLYKHITIGLFNVVVLLSTELKYKSEQREKELPC